MFVAGFFQVGFMALIIGILDLSWKLFGCLIIGLAAGITISILSEVFTSFAYLPTQSIAQSARIGPANVVIQGLAVGTSCGYGMLCSINELIMSPCLCATMSRYVRLHRPSPDHHRRHPGCVGPGECLRHWYGRLFVLCVVCRLVFTQPQLVMFHQPWLRLVCCPLWVLLWRLTPMALLLTTLVALPRVCVASQG